MANPAPALQLNNVTKVFRAKMRLPDNLISTSTEVVALRQVSFHVGQGEIVGLIGANGAGKTTLLKTMSGALTPSSGEVTSLSKPKLISGKGLRLPNLSISENVRLVLAAHGRTSREAKKEARELLELAELDDHSPLPYRTLSTGSRRRLDFFLAMVSEPGILLLDEVLALADRRFQRNAADILRSRMEGAQCAVISSNSMKTITQSCSRAILLQDGKLVFDGSVKDAVAHYEEQKRLTALRYKHAQKPEHRGWRPSQPVPSPTSAD